MTLSIRTEVRRRMEKFPQVNWSAAASDVFERIVNELEKERSK